MIERLGGEKRVKNPVADRGRNTRTIVANADASIVAQYGISGPGTHTEVGNRGTISATLVGLAFDGPTEIRNSGMIHGKVFGSLGDDTFVLSNARTRIVEYGGEGTDTVASTVSYTLGNNLNRLILLGNAGGNLIHGMAGGDMLSGGLGTDRQRGGTGADTWILLGGDDRLVLKGVDHTVLERTDFEFTSR